MKSCFFALSIFSRKLSFAKEIRKLSLSIDLLDVSRTVLWISGTNKNFEIKGIQIRSATEHFRFVNRIMIHRRNSPKNPGYPTDFP